ncbi:MAG: hypothetical protein AAF602_06475 [Myxococcota bacterium]
MDLQLGPGLIGGAIGSALFTVAIVGSYLFAKEIWVHEVSGGEVPFEGTPRDYAWVAVILASMLAGSVGTAWWVAATGGSFWEATLAAWWVQVAINVVDLVFIDIVLYQWIHPWFMQFDGIQPLKGTWPHVVGAIRGITVIGVPLALVSAGLAWAIA